jgi:hypothetical protein
MFIFIVTILFLLICLGYLVWIEEQIYNPPEIPETELEKRAKSIKYR